MTKRPEQNEQRARALDKEARQLAVAINRSWAKIGRLCAEMSENKYHQLLGFERFDDWIEDALGTSRTTAYKAFRAARELRKTFKDDELEELTLENADTLSRVPSSKRRRLLARAKDQTAREFKASVAKQVGDLHLEEKQRLVFRPTESQAKIIHEGLQRAMQVNELCSMEEALEAVCIDYLEKHGNMKMSRIGTPMQTSMGPHEGGAQDPKVQ